MLAIRIIGTVLIGISAFTAFLKNINIWGDRKGFGVRLADDIPVIISTLIGFLWRAFVIVALWIIH